MREGYSGTPLGKKLGVRTGQRTWRLGMPDGVAAEIAEWGERPELLASPEVGLDHAHVFSTERSLLEDWLPRLYDLLAPDGMVWVSWPMKASKVETDITEDSVREIALPVGFVDVKVCAVDKVWSGLKLVIRKENRPGRTP